MYCYKDFGGSMNEVDTTKKEGRRYKLFAVMIFFIIACACVAVGWFTYRDYQTGYFQQKNVTGFLMQYYYYTEDNRLQLPGPMTTLTIQPIQDTIDIVNKTIETKTFDTITLKFNDLVILNETIPPMPFYFTNDWGYFEYLPSPAPIVALSYRLFNDGTCVLDHCTVLGVNTSGWKIVVIQ